MCIFRLCLNLKTHLFIYNVLSTILLWIQKKSVFDQYVVTNTAHTVNGLCNNCSLPDSKKCNFKTQTIGITV